MQLDASRVSGTVIGFDFSRQRIGVAIASTLTRTASPLTTLSNPADGGTNWQDVESLIQQWNPAAIVVGLPLTVDGGEQQETLNARRFGQRIHGRYGLPVYFQDERYTTQLARNAAPNRRAPRATQGEDAIAAQFILQSWLDAIAHSTSNGVQ